jgi:hypothetical protein
MFECKLIPLVENNKEQKYFSIFYCCSLQAETGGSISIRNIIHLLLLFSISIRNINARICTTPTTAVIARTLTNPTTGIKARN